jgi:serine/threonine protein kinase
VNDGETVLSGPPQGAGGTPAAADIDEKVFAEAVRRGLITPSQGTTAREEARSKGVPLLEALVRRGLLTEEAAREIDEETKEDFVPGYRVIAKLGEGGMGVVYKALQKRLDREVALKVVMPHLAADPTYLKRFEREARAVAKLNHPGIVAAYDYGESNGRVFLAMEFVDGVNCAECIRRDGPMEEGKALALVRDVAAGLAHAQAAGIIHRDIKPANILLANRRPGDTHSGPSSGAKVTDLGLARSGNQAGATELTAAGAVLGTPGYMAPEQAFGRDVDHRADIYALGATLYQLVTGLRPFDASTPVAVIARQQTDRLADPRDGKPALSPGLAALLQGMLSREPATRYPGYRELLSDIDRVRQGILPEHPVPPAQHRSIADPSSPVETPATVALPPRPSTVAQPTVASAGASPAPHPGVDPSLPEAPKSWKRGPREKSSRVPVLVGIVTVVGLGIAGYGYLSSMGDNTYGHPVKPSPPVRNPDPTPAPAPGPAVAPEEIAALKTAREARDADDPVAVLAALEGFEEKHGSSPDLPTAKRLRAWAEAEAPMATVNTEPPGAMLLLAGDEIGKTPRSFRSRVGVKFEAEVRLEGYETRKEILWVERDRPPTFLLSLKPAAPPDPEPAVTLVPDGDPRPLWTGTGLGRWSGAGGEWTVSDPGRKAVLEEKEQDEPPAMLRGRSPGLGTARLDLANLVKGADGWRLQWQMIGEGRRTGTVLVEMQFAVRESGTALVLGIDDQNVYIGTRDGATGALKRVRTWKDVPANRPHSFAVEFHGDVFVAYVDGKKAGSAAAPKDLSSDRTIRAAVEGGAGYFSDIEILRLRKP